MKYIPQCLSRGIRARVLSHYGIPYSQFGLDPGLLRFFPKWGPINLIDIGASAGDIAFGLDTEYGIRRAVLIEPQPSRCAQLRLRFAEPRFAVCECAVSDEETESEMEVLNWDLSSSLLPVRRDLSNVNSIVDLGIREKIRTRVRTLDGITAEFGLQQQPIDLVKIDVQGAELLVLRGAERTLSSVKFLLTEVSFAPLYDKSCVFGQVHEFLTARDFKLLAISEGFRGQDGALLQADALFARSAPPSCL